MTYTSESFFEKIKPMVLTDMRETGILASLTAAQAFIESDKGNSGLTQKANNLFGIKGTFGGQSVKMLTTEYYNGVPCRVYADFRKYPTWFDSINDHSALFNRLKRYSNLRGETDYVKVCNYVAQDGYATSPVYATTLLNVCNRYKLYEWNAEVLNKPIDKQETLSPGKYYPTLKKGDRNDYVYHWQKFLNINGYYCGVEDGIFGPNTERAVKDWQRSHSLVPDGIIGPLTWNAIYG